MGATNCPETPRQRMIGMMYLVLTAMLALNVSKDILNAFSIVDEALQASNQIAIGKNAQDYAELNRQKAILGEDKVAKEFEKAMKIKEISNEIVKEIYEIKAQYIEFVEGESAYNEDGSLKSVAQLHSKDNISKASNFMVNGGKSVELKNKLATYREALLAFVDEKDREAMSEAIGLDVNEKFRNANGLPETWETHYFDGVIFAAGVTLINKIIGEIRVAESEVLKYVIRSISKDDFKFSDVVAKVIPKSQIVFQGEAYEAEIILAAFDNTQAIDAYWRSGTGVMTSTAQGTHIRGDDGIAKLKIPSNQVGDFNYTGLVSITGADGILKTYPFNNSYMVMAPSGTVAADKMNVLYAGIENPISASASVSPEKTSISLSDGTYTKTGSGTYNVNIPEKLIGQTVTISVLADINGKQQTMFSRTFRVKRVPDPTPALGKIKGGRITKQELLANPFVLATLGEDFVYDLKWNVVSYQVVFVVKGIEDAPIPCTDRNFSTAVINKINNSSPGTTIWFQNIKASSPAVGTSTRNLNDIVVILR